MTKIISKTNCGNSPKQAFIEAFNILFAKADLPQLMEKVTSDISWTIVGEKRIAGKDAFEEELKKMQSYKIQEMEIDKVVSHGKFGSANGIIITDDGKRYAFADFYEFKNTKGDKFKSITSYSIPLGTTETNGQYI